eukprot:TRINITY_DN407_c1_g2_i1.p1 TRINITY_DN407_c1_g2~~TRINITY_DN407_c1_g2_i1.p1  ORF type:complete len:1053 (+),score=344.92 TRINITY_DN407_c1_g2_i1:22-3159(+)
MSAKEDEFDTTGMNEAQIMAEKRRRSREKRLLAAKEKAAAAMARAAAAREKAAALKLAATAASAKASEAEEMAILLSPRYALTSPRRQHNNAKKGSVAEKEPLKEEKKEEKEEKKEEKKVEKTEEGDEKEVVKSEEKQEEKQEEKKEEKDEEPQVGPVEEEPKKKEVDETKVVEEKKEGEEEQQQQEEKQQKQGEQQEEEEEEEEEPDRPLTLKERKAKMQAVLENTLSKPRKERETGSPSTADSPSRPLTHVKKARRRPNRKPATKKPTAPEGSSETQPAESPSTEANPAAAALGRLKTNSNNLSSSGGSSKPSGPVSAKDHQKSIVAGLVAFSAVKHVDGPVDPDAPKGPVFNPLAVLSSKRKSARAAGAKAVKMLIRISGKSRIHVRQVEMSSKSLNDANVFVFDALNTIFVFHGAKCNKMERATALDVVTRLNRRLHGSRCKIAKFSWGAKDNDEDDLASFWEELGGSADDIQSVEVGQAIRDEGAAIDSNDSLQVFNLDSREFEEVEGKRHQDLLKNDRSFILDCGSEFFVWHGIKTKSADKKEAIAKADAIFAAAERPEWTFQQRAMQGGESILFISKFITWTPEATLSGSGAKRGSIAKSKYAKQKKTDVRGMHTISRPLGGKTIDDGKDGSLKVWEVKGGTKTLVPESSYGNFYADKSYICMYTWGNGQRYHLYFWQGNSSTTSDKGTAAGVVMDINMRLCKNSATQIRVPMLKETKHFLLVVDGMFIVHNTAVDWASETCLYQGREAYTDMVLPESPRTKLLGLESKDITPVRIAQVPLSASVLYTGDVFLLSTPSTIFVWHGAKSTENCQSRVLTVVKKQNTREAKVEIVKEGEETPAFWEALGGKKEYLTQYADFLPKFFYCDNKLGHFSATRIYDFVKTDMNMHKHAIIDTFHNVYLWIGSKSNVQNRKLALETVKEYIEKATDGREKKAGIYVKEGYEPAEFALAFLAFQFSGKDSSEGCGLVDDLLSEYNVTFTWEQLKDKASLPPTVDQGNLQNYLSDEDFLRAFEMTREEFTKVPKWKESTLKKKAGLF